MVIILCRDNCSTRFNLHRISIIIRSKCSFLRSKQPQSNNHNNLQHNNNNPSNSKHPNNINTKKHSNINLINQHQWYPIFLIDGHATSQSISSSTTNFFIIYLFTNKYISQYKHISSK